MAIINLDKPRTLKFGVVAARQFKKTFGQSLIEALQPAFSGKEGSGNVALDLDWATNILWAGLLHEQRTLTLDKTAELLENYLDGSEGTLRTLYTLYSEALDESARVWGAKAEEDQAPEGKVPPVQGT